MWVAAAARIWRCCGCGVGRRLQLRFYPQPGSLICRGCSPRKKRREKVSGITTVSRLEKSGSRRRLDSWPGVSYMASSDRTRFEPRDPAAPKLTSLFFFLPHGSSWAREQTHVTALTQATVVATPDSLTARLPGNAPKPTSFKLFLRV